MSRQPEQIAQGTCKTSGHDDLHPFTPYCYKWEGAAAPLEPRQEFAAKLERDWLAQKEIADFRNWMIEQLWVSKNLQEELALWKRSMCVLYEMIERTECPHPPAAIGLVTSSVDKLRNRILELEKEITALREKP